MSLDKIIYKGQYGPSTMEPDKYYQQIAEAQQLVFLIASSAIIGLNFCVNIGISLYLDAFSMSGGISGSNLAKFSLRKLINRKLRIETSDTVMSDMISAARAIRSGKSSQLQAELDVLSSGNTGLRGVYARPNSNGIFNVAEKQAVMDMCKSGKNNFLGVAASSMTTFAATKIGSLLMPCGAYLWISNTAQSENTPQLCLFETYCHALRAIREKKVDCLHVRVQQIPGSLKALLDSKNPAGYMALIMCHPTNNGYLLTYDETANDFFYGSNSYYYNIENPLDLSTEKIFPHILKPIANWPLMSTIINTFVDISGVSSVPTDYNILSGLSEYGRIDSHRPIYNGEIRTIVHYYADVEKDQNGNIIVFGINDEPIDIIAAPFVNTFNLITGVLFNTNYLSGSNDRYIKYTPIQYETFSAYVNQSCQ